MRGELAAGGRLELHHRGAVEKADEQPSLVKEEAERRPADMVLPGHLETREAHRVNVAWGAVGGICSFAVVGNDHRHQVFPHGDRALFCPVL